jgi:hypothetical protein
MNAFIGANSRNCVLPGGRPPARSSADRWRRAGWLISLAVVCMAVLSGCDRGPAVAQVSGKVLYKDGSVPKGGVRVVRFEPITAEEVRKGASGTIGPDGSFEMYTRKPGDGVFLGEYAVTFAVWKGPRDPTSLIDEKYTMSTTTPYKVKIDGDKTDLEFEIEPARGVAVKRGT